MRIAVDCSKEHRSGTKHETIISKDAKLIYATKPTKHSKITTEPFIFFTTRN